MDRGDIRRNLVILYSIIIVFIIGIGFLYSNQSNSKIDENYNEFQANWIVDGSKITLPYATEGLLTATNHLPVVYGNQFLIIKIYYEYANIYVDNKLIYRNTDNKLFNVFSTNVGKKEIYVPMKPEYSEKEVRIEVKLQESPYGAEFYDAIISTRSGYAISVLKKEMAAVTLFVVLVVSGLMEVNLGLYFIVRKSRILRKLSFQALVYAGLFSILAGIWLVCATRIPYIIFGHMTGFAIMEIVSFTLLPLAFLELIRAANFRVSSIDKFLDSFFALLILTLFILCIVGVIDWGDIVFIDHFIDIFVVGLVCYYTYTSVRAEKSKIERNIIAIGNSIFLLFCIFALVMYINNLDSNYNIFIVLGLMIYMSTQVGLIYHRIGLKVEEEAELVQVKEFAYTDDLTKLTNRRYFYEELASIASRSIMKDTTIIFMDVNRLKYVNDTMGHDAGDELLIGAAQCIEKTFGKFNTSVMSRMGGDEFVVMLMITESELLKCIEYFNKITAEWTGQYINGISVSVGYASARDYQINDLNELCKIADDNMYMAKKKYYENSGFDRRK